MKPGTLVSMSADLKRRLRGDCVDGHKGKLWSEDAECWNCSSAHVDEFGDCVGIVEDPMFAEYPDLEVNVRWLPSRLRYAYLPSDLVIWRC